MPIHFEDATLRIHKVVASTYANNAYVIVSKATGDSVVIDTPADAAKVMEEARGTTVKAILITHNHFDHLEGFEAIKAGLGAPTASHAADAYPDIFTFGDHRDGDNGEIALPSSNFLKGIAGAWVLHRQADRG